VTVLSRCLQFNLRRLLPEEIRGRLQQVLETEGLDHEPGALGLLARAADGSMRDGLSLLDQAIAFGGGRVTEAEVRTMLGSLSGDLGLGLIAALAEADGASLLAEVERISSLTPDFGELLKELIGLLHRIALFQQVPGLIPADDPDRERIAELAERLAPEDVQLYYQVALTGQQDLPLAPDPRVGFEMVLLRALAFRPAGAVAEAMRSVTPAPDAESRQQPGPARRSGTTPGADRDLAPPTIPYPDPPPGPSTAPRPAGNGATAAGVRDADTPALASTADWHRLVDGLRVGGVASQLAHNCTLLEWTAGRLTLALDPAAEQLRSRGTEQRLREALEGALGVAVRLEIQVARPQQETPAQRRVREGEERQRRAQEAMDNDPVVVGLREQLDAQWVPGSVQPTD
jgi:DNA polymerase-3 subunit gamma/tau